MDSDTKQSWVAYLIERDNKGATEYLTGATDIRTGEYEWTTDPLKALHMCRREDAERVAEDCEDCLITQHEFVGDPVLEIHHKAADARQTYESELQNMLTDREDCLAALLVFHEGAEDGVQTLLQTAWHPGSAGQIADQVIDTGASLLLQVWVMERGLASYLGEQHTTVHDRVLDRFRELVRMVDKPENQAAFTIKFRKE